MNLIRRIIYQVHLNFAIRNLLWLFKSLLPEKYKIPVNGIIKVHLGKNRVIFKANETSPMLRELYWNYYKCDFEFTNILLDLTKNSKVFFDIGANIGYYTMIAKKANPELNIYSFEPSNGPFHFLKQNLELNGFKGIQVLKLAVSDQNSVVDFYEDINPKYKYQKYHVSGTGNTSNTWQSQQTNKYNIDCVKIDDFISKASIDRIDLMKIDTEGTEDKVLLGALNSINKFQPIIICEVLPNKIENELLKIIESIKYEIYHHIESTDKLVLVSKFIDSEDRNYIFVPKEKIHLLNKYI